MARRVIDTKTNIVEHPELVAERIGRFADVVGKENVIAGTDCGFGTMPNEARRACPERIVSEGLKSVCRLVKPYRGGLHPEAFRRFKAVGRGAQFELGTIASQRVAVGSTQIQNRPET
jgi:hypothetical protein